MGLAPRLRHTSVQLGLALRVIAVSTQNEPPGLSSAEGFERYLAKPVSMGELDEVLRTTLR